MAIGTLIDIDEDPSSIPPNKQLIVIFHFTDEQTYAMYFALR